MTEKVIKPSFFQKNKILPIRIFARGALIIIAEIIKSLDLKYSKAT